VIILAGAVAGGWAVSRWQGNRAPGWAEGPTQVPAAPAPETPPARTRVDDAPQAAVRPPQEPAPAPQPAPQGTVFINATPWGSVYVDGRLVGNTPQVNLRLDAGTHTLRVVRDGFVPWEREVRVAAGGTVRITDIVLQPIEP
jgi:hypothetical protein